MKIQFGDPLQFREKKIQYKQTSEGEKLLLKAFLMKIDI